MNDESKRYFTSRVLTELNQKISACGTDEVNILLARKSFHLARHSLISEAKEIIVYLRKKNVAWEPRLSAWIMFAEGIIEHSETTNSARARDRVFRAYLIGQVGNDPTLAGTAAAWLAYFSFMAGAFGESCDYLRQTRSWALASDSEAQSRAAMVIGLAYFYVNDEALAKKWMHTARSHAIDSGDIAMQNIVLFNLVAQDVSRLTLLDCIASVDEKELSFTTMMAQSASNLNYALGITTQPSMLAMQKAELLTVKKDWPGALALFENGIDLARRDGLVRWAPKFLSHRAWCHANLNNFDHAQRDVNLAIEGLDLPIDHDDLCVLHSRVAQTFNALGMLDKAEEHKQSAALELSLYKDEQAQLRHFFDRLLSELEK